MEHDVAGQRGFNWRPIVENARNQGYDAVRFRNMYDRGSDDLQEQMVVLNKDAINLESNPLAGALTMMHPAPPQQGPTMSDMRPGDRRISPEEEAQRQALIRYLEGGQ